MEVGDEKWNAKFRTFTTRLVDSLRGSMIGRSVDKYSSRLTDRSDSVSVESVFGCEIEVRLNSSLQLLVKVTRCTTERYDVSHIVLHDQKQPQRPNIPLEFTQIPVSIHPAPSRVSCAPPHTSQIDRGVL